MKTFILAAVLALAPVLTNQTATVHAAGPVQKLFIAIDKAADAPNERTPLVQLKTFLKKNSKHVNQRLYTTNAHYRLFNGFTPLAYAVYRANEKALILVIENGADPSIRFKHQNGFEMLPVTYALIRCSEPAIRVFQAHNIYLAPNEEIPTHLEDAALAKDFLPAYKYVSQNCLHFSEVAEELEFLANNPNVTDQLQEAPLTP